MERIKEDLSKPLYRKLPGTGGLRLKKPTRRIKPGERIRVTPEELGKYIKEFELIEEVGTTLKRKSSEENPPEQCDRFKAVSRGSGWYDIIDILTNKRVNEKGYRQNEAEKHAEDMNKSEFDALN